MAVNMIRQGDVLLVRRTAPKSPQRVEGVQGLRVPGERTGHAHTLTAEVYQAGTSRLLHLPEPAMLTHDEHAAIKVPAGWWEPVLQREFVPSTAPASRARFD